MIKQHNYLFVLLLFTMGVVHTQKTVLVTGGAGFIGSHVAEKLLEKQYRVVIVDNFYGCYATKIKKNNIAIIRKKDTANRLCFYDADITDKDVLENIFKIERPTLLCHVAAYPRVNSRNVDTYVQTNIAGTVHLLECTRRYGVEHVVFTSSNQVYGEKNTTPFVEDEPADYPSNMYGASKRAGEIIAYTYYHNYNISCTCLRLFTIYGPRQRPMMEPCCLFDLLLNNKKIKQRGGLDRLRDFVYIDDTVTGIISALEKPCGFEIINIGGGDSVTTQQFLHIVEQVVGIKGRYAFEHIPMHERQSNKKRGSIAKAKRLLNYEPRVSLREGIQKMYQWYMREYVPLVEKNRVD